MSKIILNFVGFNMKYKKGYWMKTLKNRIYLMFYI